MLAAGVMEVSNLGCCCCALELVPSKRPIETTSTCRVIPQCLIYASCDWLSRRTREEAILWLSPFGDQEPPQHGSQEFERLASMFCNCQPGRCEQSSK